MHVSMLIYICLNASVTMIYYSLLTSTGASNAYACNFT